MSSRSPRVSPLPRGHLPPPGRRAHRGMPSSASGSVLILLGDAITLAIPEFRHPDSLHHPGDGIEAYSARCESPGHGPFDVSHLEIDPGAIMARHITLPFARAPEQPATPSRSGNSAISLPSMCTRSRAISKTPSQKRMPSPDPAPGFQSGGDIHLSLFCAG